MVFLLMKPEKNPIFEIGFFGEDNFSNTKFIQQIFENLILMDRIVN